MNTNGPLSSVPLSLSLYLAAPIPVLLRPTAYPQGRGNAFRRNGCLDYFLRQEVAESFYFLKEGGSLFLSFPFSVKRKSLPREYNVPFVSRRLGERASVNLGRPNRSRKRSSANSLFQTLFFVIFHPSLFLLERRKEDSIVEHLNSRKCDEMMNDK